MKQNKEDAVKLKTIVFSAQVSEETDLGELQSALSVFSYPVSLSAAGKQIRFTPVQEIVLEENGKLNVTIQYPDGSQ
jgi:hypothetical protein